MASFPAEILVKVLGINKAEAEVEKLRKKVEKLDKAAKVVLGGVGKAGSAGLGLAKRNVNDYINTLSKLDKRLGGLGRRFGDVAKAFDFGGKTVVGVAGLNALSSALQGLPRWAGGANDALQGFASALQQITAPISVVTDAVQALGPAGVATAGGIAAATAAVMAFGPAIRRAGKQAEDFKKSFSGSFEVTQDIISEKTIRDALSAAVGEQKKLSAGTREYTQKTEEVLAIQRELTAELRRQQTVLNMVNKEQIAIANNVKKNINASAATRQASGFADFSQRAGAQTAIDKSIARALAKRIEQASRVLPDVGKMPLALPSSTMLDAEGRNIKRIETAYEKATRTFNEGIQRGIRLQQKQAEEAERIANIYGRPNQLAAKPKKESQYDLRGDLRTAYADRTAGFKRLAKAESEAKLEAARSTAQLKGEQIAQNKVLIEAKKRFEATIAANKKAQQSEKQLAAARNRTQAANKKARNRRRENLLLGAGFPLLFGGGAGSIAGGIGGALLQGSSDGFGLQVFLSAFGQVLDQAVQRLNDLAATLNDTGDVFEALDQAGFRVSGSLKNVVKELEETGQLSRAYAIQLSELQKAYGKDAVRDLSALDRGNQRLVDSFKRLNAVLFAPLIPLATAISNISSGVINQLARLFEFLAGNPQNRGSRPDFRLEGEFAQASGVDRRIAEASGRLYTDRQKAIEKEEELIDKINSNQQKITNLRSQERQKEAEFEQKKFSLTVERARIEADNVRYKLSVEKQIRDLALARAQTELSGEIKRQQAVSSVAQKALEVAGSGRETASDTTIDKYFDLLREADRLDADKIRAQLQEAFALGAPIDPSQIEAFVKTYKSLLDIQRDIQREEFKTGEEKLRENLEIEKEGLQYQLDMTNAITEAERSRLTIDKEILALKRKFPKATNEELAPIIALIEKLNQVKSPLNEYITNTTRELNNIEQQLVKVAQTLEGQLASGIANFFNGIVDGSKSAEEAFADMLKGMGQALVQQGAIMIAQYIAIGIARLFAGMGSTFGSQGTQIQNDFGNFFRGATSVPGRSTGGPVGADRPYMVGENGPELFVPRTSGTVVNNEDTRSALARYNSGNNDMVVNYSPNIQSTTINGQEYVTVEQMNIAVSRGMETAAKKGAQGGFVRTMSSLKNNRSNRKTIGL